MKSLMYTILLVSFTTISAFSQFDTVNFILKTTPDKILAGEDFCVEFHTENFTNIVGFQSELIWNPSDMSYLESFQTPDQLIGPLNFNESMVADGKLPFLWTNANAARQTLEDSTRIFTICFNAGDDLEDDISLTLEKSLIYSEDDNGTYTEQDVIFLNGGASGASFNVTNSSTSIIDLAGLEIQVYPNPVDELLQIVTDQVENYYLELISVDGKIVISQAVTNGLNVSHLDKGIYTLKITDVKTKEFVTEKVLIE